MRKRILRLFGFLSFTGLLVFLNACTMVGPDFTPPKADLAPEWTESGDGRVRKELPEYKTWWRIFDDPTLESLVKSAYEQNLPLRIAGVRVLEARALLGVVVGEFYPQSQTGFGGLEYNRISGNSIDVLNPGQGNPGFGYTRGNLGVGASWEIDFWGKFRRAIQSADANLLASVAAYDNVLVSLTADVARTYVVSGFTRIGSGSPWKTANFRGKACALPGPGSTPATRASGMFSRPLPCWPVLRPGYRFWKSGFKRRNTPSPFSWGCRRVD